MSSLTKQLKWQLLLLQKNNIISISLVVTLIYGSLLFSLRDTRYIDQLLVSLVLNDPAVIGYFFIALAVYTEIKQGTLAAIRVTPVNLHLYLISKTLALSLVGTVCSLGLAIPIKGLHFDLLQYTLGTFGICLQATLLGLALLTYAREFLSFALRSVPVFLLFTGISLLQYLGAIDLGSLKYLFPVEGPLLLLDHSLGGVPFNAWYAYLSLLVSIPLLYLFAFHRFTKKIIRQ